MTLPVDLIENELKTFEVKFKNAVSSQAPMLDRIMRYIVKRKGKQLRPMFVFLSAKLCGEVDQPIAALITDLKQRGLLDETLVVCLGEMGRTPTASERWGRSHWSTLFPAVIAGAGIRGGNVYGSTDKDAAYATDKPVKPEDLASTIYYALGIDPHMHVPDAQGRPVAIVDGGRPLTELFGG